MDTHRRAFDEGLDELKRRLLHMAALAETMIDQAIVELVSRNERSAETIPQSEQELNRLQIEVDDVAMRLLATQQPVAADLRFIVASTRINSELERIGDLVINITQNAQTLLREPPLKPLIDIPRMADLARKMVRESLDAFVQHDPVLAEQVRMTDDQLDSLKQQIFRELLTYMMSDAKTIERALALILISRHLERIGDHACNIAEDVIYLVQGRDVRHPHTPKVREAGEPQR